MISVAAMGFIDKSSKCCGYGMDGKGTEGGDCLIIPNAIKAKKTGTNIIGNQFCGKQLQDDVMTAAAQTVCSKDSFTCLTSTSFIFFYNVFSHNSTLQHPVLD